MRKISFSVEKVTANYKVLPSINEELGKLENEFLPKVKV